MGEGVGGIGVGDIPQQMKKQTMQAKTLAVVVQLTSSKSVILTNLN
jgi:hypothetical protein